MILGALVALVVAALALPALAQQLHQNQNDFLSTNQDNPGESSFDVGNPNRVEASDNRAEERQNRADDGFFFGSDDFDRSDAQDWWNNRWWDTNNWWDDQNDDASGVSQSFDQEADSGDLNQSFNVTGGGANSNQCVGAQQVGNTGNAQNQIGVIQYGSEADDFSFEDSGASINVSPTNLTSCDQQVNQAASAFGGR
jgi:hypothetical protein